MTLVIGYHERPVCFYYNTTINAANCEECGETFLVPQGCQCGRHKGEDDGRVQALLDQWRGEAIRKREEAFKASQVGSASDDGP